MDEKDDFKGAAKPIKILGDPVLRRVCEPVTDFTAKEFSEDAKSLYATLVKFRSEHGFGRAVSAPQIGISRRFIALKIGARPQLIVNPEITRTSPEKFTMWDDCMSFPNLLVRLERYESVSIKFQDENGKTQNWTDLDRAVSELLQHEIDHLDGVLAIDRAMDQDSIILREYFEQNREAVNARVDYTIY